MGLPPRPSSARKVSSSAPAMLPMRLRHSRTISELVTSVPRSSGATISKITLPVFDWPRAPVVASTFSMTLRPVAGSTYSARSAWAAALMRSISRAVTSNGVPGAMVR